MLRESLFLDKKILQFDLLLDCPQLFHAIFLNDELQTLFDRPIHRLDQIHSALIEEVPPRAPADAMITRKPNEPLLIRHADCQSAIFYDPVTGSLAAAHAGWRGLVASMYTQVVHKMIKDYQVNPANLLCAIGPSLGPEQAEFKGWESYFPPHFAPFQIKENHFDLRAIARAELLSLNLLPHHLEIANECTVTDPRQLPSWRRNKSIARLATISMINTGSAKA